MGSKATGPLEYHENGFQRRTDFGWEVAHISPGRAEQLSVVERRPGPRDWRWRLGTTLEPTLRGDGSVTFAGSSQTVGRTAKVQILRTEPKKPFTPAGKKVGIGVVKGDQIKNLRLDPKFKVNPVSSGQVFDATGLRTGSVEGVVIDLDRESISTIAGLRQVFPELRIVALSSSPTTAAYARRAGASIVIIKPTSPELVAALVRQLIWR